MLQLLGLDIQQHTGSVADNPAVGDQAVPAGHERSSTPLEGTIMLRLQAPLPDRYTLASPEELESWIAAAKGALGERLVILGHHYQRDEVIKWADARGDSFRLARFAADNERATDIVFCGVHFMAESADVLTGAHQRVILPDLNAGCSMADMADIDQVEECWDALAAVTDVDRVVPITYMNSSAALKAFVGEHGGAVCTSSNARAVLEWALAPQGDGRPGGQQVLFFPDQHLGRNTGFDMGYRDGDMRVWNPRFELGGLEDHDIKEATLLLWKGHCSVHQRFRPEHVAAFRAAHPDGVVLVHPECAHDVVELADRVGSTERILDFVEAAAPGTVLGVGTEIHMVQRMAAEHPELTVESLDPLICPCSTMFRIDAPHLAWVLEHLVDGEVVNQIKVDAKTAEWARVALQRMLDIT
jgi:quinolinate synthase